MVIPQTEIVLSKEGVELLRRTVPPGSYVIGRSPDCDLVVPTELISRRHAKLTIHYYETFIEDLGSRNGTFVAGQRMEANTRVFPGQAVALGSLEMKLHRTKVEDPAQTISPHSAAVQRLVPEDFLRGCKYGLGAVIAQGGMGVILEARDNLLRRKVAIKRTINSSVDPDQLVRFIEEAQITAQLDHPNIVPVYELGVDEQEQVFYSMKLVRGITLHEVLESLGRGLPETVERFPLAALLNIFRKTCDALAYAHSKGVLHRDLKPANVMIGEYGEVLVMDWGLARAGGQTFGGPERTLVQSVRQDEGAERTMIGMVLGTPHYMSPEQARGETDKLDARTDIYALGAILYHILFLEPPVSDDDVGVMLQSVGSGKVAEALDRPNHPAGRRHFPHLPGGVIPPGLAMLVRRAMALSKSDRFSSMRELQAAIEGIQGGLASCGSVVNDGVRMRKEWVIILVLSVAVAVLSIMVLQR